MNKIASPSLFIGVSESLFRLFVGNVTVSQSTIAESANAASWLFHQDRISTSTDVHFDLVVITPIWYFSLVFALYTPIRYGGKFSALRVGVCALLAAVAHRVELFYIHIGMDIRFNTIDNVSHMPPENMPSVWVQPHRIAVLCGF